ncbi:MAG: coproporphyrinogen dehydrogenase HemZ, partial [Peptostreptococcaceae bacterium]
MLGVILKGHDFNYEVAELIKLFTTQFSFVDNKDVGMMLENSVVYYNDKVFSKTVYLENYQVIYDAIDHRSIEGLSEQEIKKVTKETIKRSMYNVLMKKFNTYVPWGILTGIRPVKIVHTLLDNNLSDEDIRENLKVNYLISDEKIDLALSIAKRERSFIYPIDKNKISLYVSIPFCPTRCYY